MREDEFSEAMGGIDEELIAAAEKSREQPKKRSKAPLWIGVCSVAACAVIASAVLLGMGKENPPISTDSSNVHRLAQAVYPEMPKFNVPYSTGIGLYTEEDEAQGREWSRYKRDVEKMAAGRTESARNFLDDSMKLFLSDADGKNAVFSPINTYMALAVAAETAEGSGRQQILDALGAGSIEELRDSAGRLWSYAYSDDGLTTCVLGNSLWLRDDSEYDADTLQRLADSYYASSFSGKMGSEEYDSELRKWLNEQTGGFLTDYTDDVRLSPETVLGLYSTVYFSAQWDDRFREENNTQGVFHSPDGDVQAEFMNWTDVSMSYFWGEDFAAIALHFEDDGMMWFVLPDEDVTAEELAQDSELYGLLHDGYEWEDRSYPEVTLSIPKFDVSAKTELKQGLQQLGITDIFDSERADFTPLSEELDGAAVGSIDQSARVMIDEDGCTAASYVEIEYVGAAPPDDKVEFILDRPFLFFITDDSSDIYMPLFGGVVNHP